MIRKAIETARLFVVSHDPAVLRSLWSIGKSDNWQFESSPNAWEAIDRMQSGTTPDLLLLDISADDSDGLHILRWMRRLRPELSIVLIGHGDDAERKQEAIRMGARGYLTKPFREHQLELVIGQYLCESREEIEAEITSDDVEPVSSDNFFVGISPIMRKLRAQAVLLAEANVPVLILGESGSGKETTARLIHKLSVRSGFEFAKVNCAALPADLLERELFGYQRDSMPGRVRSAKFELCDKGTILLDEITEMPMELQANLLQVLQSKRFLRPKSATPVDVDVRLLAASSVNMEHAISERRFREDLYYRLSAYTIHVPPLRERRDELLLLSRHFMHQLARQYGLSPRDFSPAMIEACQSYAWPGNLRELENFVKRYLMVGDRELPFENGSAALGVVNHAPTLQQTWAAPVPYVGARESPGSLKSLVQSVKLEAERNAIAAALEKTGWNRKAAARLLKVSYRTLLYKIEQYQMRSSDSAIFPGTNGHRNRAGFRSNGTD